MREVKRKGEEGVVEPQKVREKKQTAESADLGWSEMVLMRRGAECREDRRH